MSRYTNEQPLPIEAGDVLADLATTSTDVEVSAAYVYDRKGETSYTDVTDDLNISYGSEWDDIEVTIKFTVTQGEPAWITIKRAATQYKREALEADAKAKAVAAREALEALDQFNSENHNP